MPNKQVWNDALVIITTYRLQSVLPSINLHNRLNSIISVAGILAATTKTLYNKTIHKENKKYTTIDKRNPTSED